MIIVVAVYLNPMGKLKLRAVADCMKHRWCTPAWLGHEIFLGRTGNVHSFQFMNLITLATYWQSLI